MSPTPLEYVPVKRSGHSAPDPHGLVPWVNQFRRRRLPFIFCLACGLALACALPAAALDVTFDVQPRLLNLGETATATLVFHGAQGINALNLPAVDGLSIASPSIMQQNINGAHRVLMNYRLVPRRAGTFAIGPYALDLNGETIQIPEIRLEVRPGNSAGENAEREMIFVRLKLPDTSPYIHQVFDLVLQLYYLPTVELGREISLLGGFPETGFVLGPFEELQLVREEVDGHVYNLRRYRTRVRALTSGTFTLEPALRAGILEPNQTRRRDPFSGFFDSPFLGVPSTPVNVSAPPQTLTIRAIPEEGRPADFSGAVGQFALTADVRPRELKVGEPITVTLQLQGTGNIAAARPSAYTDTDLFRAYEARLLGDTPDPSADRGAKAFEQVIMPRTVDLHELPALQFSFFDPDAEHYRTVAVGPFPLTVHPSENGANALVLQIPGSNGGGGKTLVLGTDIFYIKPAPAYWLDPAARLVHRRVAMGLHAAAPLALAGLWLATRRRNRLQRDVAFARRQKAPRSARANLRKAETALRTTPTPAAVFDPLLAAVLHYFGHRLNLPPGAVDANLLHQKFIAAQIPADDLARWQEFFALADQTLYGIPPPLSHAELSTWISTVATLLRKAERSKL